MPEAQRPETAKFAESIVISPEALLADNHSEKAKKLSLAWEENKNHHNITVVVACGDARIFSPCPENTESVRSIDVGGKKSIEIFKNGAVCLIVVKGHFDGTAVTPGKKLPGCGGAAAKEEALSKHQEVIEGIEYYVQKNIEHPDTLIQTFSKAHELARATGKPTLISMQDHRTGKNYYCAAFNDNGTDKISSKLDPADLLKKYDEAAIYAAGIPMLPESVFENEKIKAFIAASRGQMAEMLRAYPDLSEIQETQNPRMIFISSKLPSIRTRYPEITKYPNSVFKLHLPREKNGEKAMPISPDVKKEIFNQIHYPIQYAIKHFGRPKESFSKANRIMVETSDIAVSDDFAVDLVKNPWIKKWLALDDDHKIIVIQNKEGITNIAEWFEVQS